MNDFIANTGKLNFLIDGFPRSIDNWDGYQEIFKKAEKDYP